MVQPVVKLPVRQRQRLYCQRRNAHWIKSFPQTIGYAIFYWYSDRPNCQDGVEWKPNQKSHMPNLSSVTRIALRLSITAMIDDTGAQYPRVLGLTAPDPSSSPQAGGPRPDHHRLLHRNRKNDKAMKLATLLLIISGLAA